MSLPHQQFTFDPYAINGDFALNCSNSMLQNGRVGILRNLEYFAGTDEEKLEDRQMRHMEQIAGLRGALKWLINEGFQENLTNAKLSYGEDHCFGYDWSMEGIVGANTPKERKFEIYFQNDWYNDIDIKVGGEVIRSINVSND